MKQDILLKKLQDIGLKASEAKVYLATLQTPDAPASAISKAAHMNRVSAYSILKRLLTKGLISMNEQNGVDHFTALDPEVFVSDVEQKAKNLAESLPLFTSFVTRADDESKHHVRLFEGIEGVKKAYKMSLSIKSSEICNYANSKNIRDHWPEYDEEYVAKRAKKNIFLKGLAPNDKEGRHVCREDDQYCREMRLIDAAHFQVENEVSIFDDKVLIASFHPDPFAILIESEAVADTQRQIFHIAWGAATK